jgi:hypothetical protein
MFCVILRGWLIVNCPNVLIVSAQNQTLPAKGMFEAVIKFSSV